MAMKNMILLTSGLEMKKKGTLMKKILNPFTLRPQTHDIIPTR